VEEELLMMIVVQEVMVEVGILVSEC